MEPTTHVPYVGDGLVSTTVKDQPISISPDPLKTVVLPSVFGIVCIVGLLGNALVMYIIQVKIRKNSLTDIYVINLAVADFIFLAMLPFWSTELAMNGRWVFGRVLCKLTSGSTHFHMYASVFFLTAMAVDRLMAVVFYRSCMGNRTRRAAKVGSAVIWVISIIISIVPFYFRDLKQGTSGYSHCIWTFNDTITVDRNWFVVHFMTRSVIAFTLPFLIISICYTWIVVFLKTRKTSGKLTSKRQDKATTMVLVVIAVFLLCWLPNQVSNAIYAAQSFNLIPQPLQLSKVHYYIHMFSTCLAWAHSCVNPMLYCFMREDLKLKLTEMVHWNAKRCCGEDLANRFLTSRKSFKIRMSGRKNPKSKGRTDHNCRVIEEGAEQSMLVGTTNGELAEKETVFQNLTPTSTEENHEVRL
uniref:somatostatin receptor type 5-like n=1 Tax=Ciona intestinalis TaxID=7719 RepID=UPI00089DBEC3|nr:somatostatin receptor type 5-like [Ciona intestinalis]|eukprot:XP_018666693.1 somatostatin receptor type 5-like [Ciona intestinalis]